MMIRLITFLFLFSVLACKSNQETQANSDEVTAIQLNIVHPPSLKSYLEQAAKRFDDKNFRLTGNRKVLTKLLEYTNQEAHDLIASGRLKADAWFAAPSYIELANSKTRNLGAKQTDCREILATPMVIAMSRSAYLDNHEHVDFSDLNAIQVFNHEQKSPAIMISNPYDHESGLASLVQLISANPKLLSEINWYGKDLDQLIFNLTNSKNLLAPLVILSEQQAITINQSYNNKLQLIYPKNGSAWQVNLLCRSEAAWVNRDKLAAFSFFAEFLRSETESLAAKQAGYRVFKEVDIQAEHKLTDKLKDTIADLTLAQYGLDSQSPKLNLESPKASDLEELLKKWEQNKKPRLVTLIVDSSGSMDGESIGFTLAALAQFVESLNSGDQVEVINFSTQPSVFLKQTANLKQLLDDMRKLEPSGGAALFDAIKMSLEQIAQEQTEKKFAQSIIVLVDGEDSASKASLAIIKSMLGNVLGKRPTQFFVIALQATDHYDLNELNELTKAGYGQLYETSTRDLLATLMKIRDKI